MVPWPSAMLPRSSELETALAGAHRRSGASRSPSTWDLLTSLLELAPLRRITGPIDPGCAPDTEEHPDRLRRALEQAEALAIRCRAPAVEPLHALAALCRDVGSVAFAGLRASGCDPPRIRAMLLREQAAPPDRRRASAAPQTKSVEPVLLPPTKESNAERIAEPTTPGRDLIAAARRGELARLIGRERELLLLADILARKRAAIPCIVGEPGTGKTALIAGLARLLARGGAAPPALQSLALIEADASTTLVGLSVQTCLVFDAVLAPELLLELARIEQPAIVAMTPSGLTRLLEAAPELQGKMTQILLQEPTEAETLEILRENETALSHHHHVTYAPEALETAARLAPRYVSDRFLPDKALALCDLAGARARRRGEPSVGPDLVAGLVAEAAGVPTERLLGRDTARLLQMESHLEQSIVGHGAILTRIANVVRRNYAGFRARRPIGSFLFLGPTGVGKTETAKALAEFLMGSPDAMIRLDMSEYMEPHSVARLIGSPPGYVGYEEGGQLTEAVRRHPDSIVLLDEIEKAHRDIFPILLQVLDEGRLTDGRGRTVDFSNTIVVMTSNLGSKHRTAAKVLLAARAAFPIELWNRIEEPLVFTPLARPAILEIARRLALASSRQLERQRDIAYELDGSALSYLVSCGAADKSLGARPLRAALGRLVEAPLAEAILSGEVQRGDRLRVERRGGRLQLVKGTGECGRTADAAESLD